MTTAHNDQPTFFLPDLCGVRALFGVVVIGELLAVILTTCRKWYCCRRAESPVAYFTVYAMGRAVCGGGVVLVSTVDRTATRNRRRDRELSIDSASGPGGQ